LVTVEPRRTRIGDPIRLTASCPAPGTWIAVPGENLKPGEKLGNLRILGNDTSVAGSLRLDLGADEPGDLEVPAFSVPFRDASGATQTVAVPAVRVAVTSVLADGDSTSLADLKPPAEVPVPWPWRTLALLAVAVVLAAGATWWLARWLRRKRAPRPAPEVALPPGVTAEAWARGELERLLASRLIENGRLREFHIALADLLRRYLELRFRLPAMERTTEEIGEEMPRALIDGAIVRPTIAALSRCDRVKFAKHAPPREEVDETLFVVREVLDRGAPPLVSVPPPQDARAVDAAGTAA
jgi:hypothetical protein